MRNILLFLIICLCLSGCGEEHYIKKANRFYDLGEYEKAIVYFDKALAANPDNYDIHIDKGISYIELGDNKNAVVVFTEAISLCPQEAYAYDCRAESYMRLKKYQEAIKDYNSTIKITGSAEGDIFRYRGSVNNDFFSIINVDPDVVYADRAVAYYFLDSLELAWKDLNYCISRNKELGHCYYWSGIIRIQLGDKENGCNDLLRAALEGYDIDPFYKEYCDCNEN